MEIKVGVCGFPKKLEELDKSLQIIEVQKTFYNFPKLETVKKWKERAPHVEWSVKASQLITHPPQSPTYRKTGIKIEDSKKKCYGYFRPTDEVFEAYRKILLIAKTLNARFILFQTPASFKPTDENVENLINFFREIERHQNILLLWEPRGWTPEILKEVFPELGVIHVVDPFKDQQIYGDIGYFRLHGRGKGYKYDYSREELQELKKMLKKEVNYVLFNNTMMYKNAQEFIEVLKEI